MLNIYVGESGKLNKKILEKYGELFDFSYSARDYDVFELNPEKINLMVWGGRFPPNKRFLEKYVHTNIVYFSTYLYNNFHDTYQLKKIESEAVFSKAELTKIIRVPFIKEVLPINVKKIVTSNKVAIGKYYVYQTDVNSIVNSIVNETELKMDKIYINLTFLERLSWQFFSKMYFFSNHKCGPLKYQITNLIKAFEKIFLTLLSRKKLSCVYIGADK